MNATHRLTHLSMLAWQRTGDTWAKISCERTRMKQPLRQLIIGTAVGVFSLGAYAQSTSMTPPPPTSPKMTTSTMTDGDYNAAKIACNAQTGAARTDCLRKAKTAHDQGETNKGGGTNASSGGGQ